MKIFDNLFKFTKSTITPITPITPISHKDVLIVDDASINRFVLRKFLHKCNINLKIDDALTGIECINLLKENDYKIIFMDIKMPIMNGDIATKEIRKYNNKVIICAVTGQIENQQYYTKIGMNECLRKPVNFNDLLFICKKYNL